MKTPPRRRAAFRFSSDRAKRSAITDLKTMPVETALQARRPAYETKFSKLARRPAIDPAAQLLPLEAKRWAKEAHRPGELPDIPPFLRRSAP